MTYYAIKSGQTVLRVVEQEAPPQEPYAIIDPWLGFPIGGGIGRVLQEANGALFWANGDPAQAWEQIREQRELLFVLGDRVALKAFSSGGSMPQAWATYQQALRDITNQADPFNITWPTPPA